MNKHSPQYRYENDAEYKTFVDVMVSFIAKSQFTPSEMREMAVHASILYELKYGVRHYYCVPTDVNAAFKTLEEFRRQRDEETEKKRQAANQPEVKS